MGAERARTFLAFDVMLALETRRAAVQRGGVVRVEGVCCRVFRDRALLGLLAARRLAVISVGRPG